MYGLLCKAIMCESLDNKPEICMGVDSGDSMDDRDDRMNVYTYYAIF